MRFRDFVGIYENPPWELLDTLKRRHKDKDDARFIQMYSARLFVISDLRQGFERYSQRTRTSLQLLQNDHELHHAWLPLLRQFPRCKSFRIAAIDYAIMNLEFAPMVPDCISPANSSRSLYCYEESAQIAEIFVPKVISCMAAAGSIVQRLQFDQAYLPNNELVWTDRYDLMNLNMGQLAELTINPKLPGGLDYDDREDEFRPSLQRDIKGLIKCCAQTLDILNCQSLENSWLLSGTPVPLPRLRALRLGWRDASSSSFCEWLSLMPNLISLEMDDYMILASDDLEEEPDSNWRFVLDAIRDHPTLKRGVLAMSCERDLKVHFDQERQMFYSYGKTPNESEPKDVDRPIDTRQLPRSPGEVEDWLKQYKDKYMEDWVLMYIYRKIGCSTSIVSLSVGLTRR